MCAATALDLNPDDGDAHVLEQCDLAPGVDWMCYMAVIDQDPGPEHEQRSKLDTAFGDGERRDFQGIDMAAGRVNARGAAIARKSTAAELHRRLFGGLDSDASEIGDDADVDDA